MHRELLTALVLLMVGAFGTASVSADIVVEVTGGTGAVRDRICERNLDLDAAARMLGRAAPVDPQAVRVVEVGAGGEKLATMPSQVDTTETPGTYTVCWQAKGEFGTEQVRRFSIVFDGDGPAPVPAQPLSATSDGATTTVTSGETVFTYRADTGGLLTQVSVNGVAGKLAWGDKIYDGKEYRLANGRADAVRLLAAGPLRAVYETESRYRTGGQAPASVPRAVYRFTHYAGEPVVYLQAKVTQDFAHQWVSLHFVEINFAAAPVTQFATDQTSGKIKQDGAFASGKEWAAVYGDAFLLGVCDSTSPGIYDGGGRHYWNYIRSGTDPMTGLKHEWKCALFFGSGPDDVKTLQAWSQAVPDVPSIQVRVQELDRQITELGEQVEEGEQDLDQRSGKDWAAAYINMQVARNVLRRAAAAASRGEIGIAAQALAPIRARLDDEKGSVRYRANGNVLSGTADGYPFLVNDKVAYFWSHPDDGAGLISIYDRVYKREFISLNPVAAPLWQISVKKGDGGRSYASTGTECRVRAVRGGLDFAWNGPLRVRATARLGSDEGLLRMRLRAQASVRDEGILTVRFPVVDGITPISADGAADVVLDTWAIGDLRPSPLTSGTQLQIHYPHGMQFTALQAEAKGLYFADEDPEANRKTLTWSPQANVLSFDISRPVLGWGSSKLVKRYASPGDVVISPFRGDWYDATQLYRRWALTAPWCAKGPIHSRADFPKWLADAPYWTIGGLNDEGQIQQEIEKYEFFGLPTGIVHAYGYYLSPMQDNLYPEAWPPKLGSENFRRVVGELQAKGMRIVPYISGSLWDEDTESYRTEMAAERGALQNADGGLTILTGYGGGQRLVAMCPGSQLWQDKLAKVSREGVEHYGVDGWYYDFLTIHTSDCFNPSHSHPISGGNYWTQSVRDLYGRLRAELKALNPDIMLTGEDNAEFVIDLLDTALSLGKVGTRAPLYQAVYHDYTMLFGGQQNYSGPCTQGRWWLLGNQNGWHGVEGVYANPTTEQFRKDGEYYRRLLHCYHNFGRPYLAYGRMLRMPRITGDLPTVTGQGSYGAFTVPGVEGSAWQAPDGTVGVFFLNYSAEAQPFEWTIDLDEAAGWNTQAKVRLSRWTAASGLQVEDDIDGGTVRRHAEIESLGMIALKLEVIR